MKILPNLLTVDSDRANFRLHGSIQDFLVQSNEPKGVQKSTVYIILLNQYIFIYIFIHFGREIIQKGQIFLYTVVYRTFLYNPTNLKVPKKTPCLARLGWAEEEARRAEANFTSENLESHGEVSSEASAFQRDEVELAKPFLIWHVMETSHQPCCMALDPLQLGNISSQCGGVGFNCILQVFGNSQKDLRAMKSNCLAVFAASLQCTDEVKVVARGTPRSQTSVTW